ncbi:MAG TPA: cob(I)yrinic acid a,c-diamide adenosyltransferase [Anaeromyxobacteraceae bacterium]|nr:cob(I)yrinic acid a,c-diamide adenosyltransferase [Anaeromyxobacteraceae bacterium]
MKIYTKAGDAGQTSLYGGGKVHKDDPRVEAYGEVDELSAAVGLARALGTDPEVDRQLVRVQDELLCVGADLATPSDSKVRSSLPPVEAAWAEELERTIDAWEKELPALTEFLLPGSSRAAAALHLARTICRRAERRAVALKRQTAVSPAVLVYLNRLSDFLFVAARLQAKREGAAETVWDPKRRR